MQITITYANNNQGQCGPSSLHNDFVRQEHVCPFMYIHINALKNNSLQLHKT